MTTKKKEDKLLTDTKKLAQQILDGAAVEEDLQVKMAALKTVSALYAMLRKIDGADDIEGSAFDEFRNKIAATDGRGAGSSSGANVVRLRSVDSPPGPESDSDEEPEYPGG